MCWSDLLNIALSILRYVHLGTLLQQRLNNLLCHDSLHPLPHLDIELANGPHFAREVLLTNPPCALVLQQGDIFVPVVLAQRHLDPPQLLGHAILVSDGRIWRLRSRDCLSCLANASGRRLTVESKGRLCIARIAWLVVLVILIIADLRIALLYDLGLRLDSLVLRCFGSLLRRRLWNPRCDMRGAIDPAGRSGWLRSSNKCFGPTCLCSERTSFGYAFTGCLGR